MRGQFSFQVFLSTWSWAISIACSYSPLSMSSWAFAGSAVWLKHSGCGRKKSGIRKAQLSVAGCLLLGNLKKQSLVKVDGILKIGMSYSKDVEEYSLQYTVFRRSEQRID